MDKAHESATWSIPTPQAWPAAASLCQVASRHHHATASSQIIFVCAWPLQPHGRQDLCQACRSSWVKRVRPRMNSRPQEPYGEVHTFRDSGHNEFQGRLASKTGAALLWWPLLSCMDPAALSKLLVWKSAVSVKPPKIRRPTLQCESHTATQHAASSKRRKAGSAAMA